MATHTNGLDEPLAYTTRTKTWAAGDQVASADLNAIQDGVIAVSDALDEHVGEAAPAAMASSWLGEATAPDEFGGFTAWVKSKTNGHATVVVLDDNRDYRDRILYFKGFLLDDDSVAAGVAPGGANDELWPAGSSGTPTTKTDVNDVLYTKDGQDGTGPSGSSLWKSGLMSDSSWVEIFCRDTDGALCCLLRNATWTTNQVVYLKVDASPQLNQY